jgi:hypothetical protein
MEKYLEDVLSSLSGLLPSSIVYLVGFILAVYHMRKHPKVFTVTCVAIGILFIIPVASQLIFHGLMIYLMEIGENREAILTAMNVISYIFTLLHTIAFALLLYAIFAGRSQLPNPKTLASQANKLFLNSINLAMLLFK